jgi:hypothetical protein
VLGEYTSSGQIDVFSVTRKKVVPIESTDRFSLRKLVQAVGNVARLHVHDGKDPVEGKHTMEQVRFAIGNKAGETDLTKTGTLGQGIWKTGSHYVLVNGGTAALYDRATHTLGRVTSPRLDARSIIDFSAGEPWVDFGVLNDLIARAADRGWARAAVEEARDVFLGWNWKCPQDSLTTALMVACTYVQTLWAWRPEVSVTGSSDCGKSTLMTTVKGMFGRLELYVQKPSEAGLRQHMANTAKAVLIDEFENDNKRQIILELFRTTSQGGVVIRGTSNQKGCSYRIQHIPWMAAIESGLTKAADRNRFIVLDLQPVGAGRRGRLVLPGEIALAEIGLKLCAVALRYADDAMRVFGAIKGSTFDGVHGRVVESFSTPAALWAAVQGLDHAGAVAALGDLLADRASIGRQGGGDEADLMKAVLDSTFSPGSGLPLTAVSEVISDPEKYLGHGKALEGMGVAMTEGRPGQRRPNLDNKKFIFMDLDKVKRYLLRGTDWAQLDCEQLVLRLAGATRVQRQVGGQRVWGIEVPARDWVEVQKGESAADLLPLPPADPPPAGHREGPAAAPVVPGRP